MSETKLAVVRIRGLTGLNYKIKSTLSMLWLTHKNYCTIVSGNPNYVGMLKAAKDYITWGEIDEGTYRLLIEKRGEEFKGKVADSKKKINYNNFFILDGKKIKKYFRLNSPRKGFGKKGLKASFPNGGALGYRGSAINDLIKRMI